MSFDQGRTAMLVQRAGAEDLAKANNRLIEPLPRTISAHERWLVNLTTGRIEVASPMMLTLGDTIYIEYEPTPEEVAALKQGQAVTVTRQMLTRLRSAEETSVADKMELPTDVREEQRKRRYQALHGTPAPALSDGGFNEAMPIPAEAMPQMPSAVSTAAAAFTFQPMPQ